MIGDALKMNSGPVQLRNVGNSPNQEAIKLAEELAERTKSGDIIDFAFVAVLRGRTIENGVSGGSDNYHLLNSGVARLAAILATLPDK